MNQRRQLVIASVAASFVALLFFVMILKPKMNQLSETRTEIETLQQEQQTLRNSLSRLKDIQRDAPLAAAKLLAVQQALPSTPDLPGFIRLAQDAATAAGVDLMSIAPSAPTALTGASGVQAIAVTLVVDAGFHRIEDFLSRIENLRRIAAISAISLSPSVDELSGVTTLQATMTMQMYVVQAGARVSTGAGATASPSASASPSPSASGSAR